jgi:glycosyltransferase involved in cell wall biosynthesis
MAVYNGEQYLRDAIDSIVGQSFSNFEFVVIDDGSTDRSLQILQEYASKDDRFKVTSRPNKGLTKSLSEATVLARGEFVARMDCDDVAMPDRFEKQLGLLRSNPALVAVGGDVTRIDADGTPMTSPRMPLTHADIEAELLLGKGGALVHPTLMVRRDALAAVGGYREKFKTAQDLDLYLRLCQRGQLANVADVVLKYRIHNNSVSSAKREPQDRDVYDILLEAYATRGRALPRHVGRRRFELTIQQYTKEFWAAMRDQGSTEARRYAWRVIRKAPLRAASWKLLAFALLGNTRSEAQRSEGS